MNYKNVTTELGRACELLTVSVPYLYEMLVASPFSQRHTLIIRAAHPIALMYAPDGDMDVDPDNWARVSFDAGIRSRKNILKQLSDGGSVFNRFWIKSILASSLLRRSSLHDSHVFAESFFDKTNSASNKEEMIELLERIGGQLCLTPEGLFQRKAGSQDGKPQERLVERENAGSQLLVRRMINGSIAGITIRESFNERFGVEITDDIIANNDIPTEVPCIVDYTRDRRFTLQQADLIFDLNPVAQYCRQRIIQMRNLTSSRPISQQENKELAVLAFKNMVANQGKAIPNDVAFR